MMEWSSSLVARRSSLVARRSSLVARRSSLVALIALLTLADAQEADADLRTQAQMAVTQSNTTGTLWTVWSVSTYGRLLARRQLASNDFRWTDFGTPAPSVLCATSGSTAAGVAATSYVSAGHIIERVYCADNQAQPSIWEFSLDNGVPQGWRNLNLAGFGTKHEIAATSILIGGHWHLFVFFTRDPDDLLVWWQDATVPAQATVAQLGILTAYSLASPLAVSRAPGASPAYLHLFAARQVGTVDVYRWDSAGPSAPWNIGRPAVGFDAMGMAAAVEDQLATGSGNYKVVLFCTVPTPNEGLYYAEASSASANAPFAWSSKALNDGSLFATGGYALAATSRSDGSSNRAIEAFALATGSPYPPNRIWRLRRSAASWTTLADIGDDGETGSRSGGLAAYPQTNRSVAAFLGAGTDGTTHRLYTKDGADAPATQAWNWANHGDGEPTSTLTAAPMGETAAAFFDGRAIVAAIDHPEEGGDQDWSSVKTLWSSTDGDTWGAQWVQVPTTHEVTSDPTVDFDDSGTAYVCLQAANLGDGDDEPCNPDQERQDDAIFIHMTTDGTYPSEEIRVDPAEQQEHRLDHPFMAIYRDPSGADRLHVVWSDETDDVVHYTSAWLPLLDDLPPPHPLQSFDDSPPPYLSVGADGQVYVLMGRQVCRIAQSDFAGCEDPPQELDDGVWDEGVSRPHLQDAPGGGGTFNPGYSSLVASPFDPDIVYWAFLRREDNGTPADEDPDGPDLDNIDETDVYFSVGTYTPGQMPFDFSPPVSVAEWEDDDSDQFAPSIVVSQEPGADESLVSVMWHDRHFGVCDSARNRCFRTRRSISTTNGASFVYPQTIPIDAQNSWSDPNELPVSCLARERFLGHYRTVRGDLLHTRHIVVGSPDGGPDFDAVLRAGWISGGWYYW